MRHSLVVSFLSLIHIVLTEDRNFNPSSLPVNSKFLNPQLDDETNLQLIDEDYDIDPNSTDDENLSIKSSIENSTKSDEKPENPFKPKLNEKFLGWGLVSWLKPVIGAGTGRFGGLYGAQYYGLEPNQPNKPGWSFPFYNYPYYDYVKSMKNAKKE